MADSLISWLAGERDTTQIKTQQYNNVSENEMWYSKHFYQIVPWQITNTVIHLKHSNNNKYIYMYS